MSKWIDNWFSNRKPMDNPLIYQNIKFKTVENFYQAMKTLDINERKKIAKMYPLQAKIYVKNINTRDDWNKIKLKVMEYALRFKFAKGTSWYDKLMSTNEEIIEWNNWSDKFWGRDVRNKEGANWLGKLLMKIRDEHNA